ncbi:hypothetical protein HDV62DRAFT_246551 [Trichoderma sp. SZMC 28011]
MELELELELGWELELGCDRAGSLGARRRQPCRCRLAGLGLCQRLRLGLCLCLLVLRLHLRLGRLATGLVFAGMLLYSIFLSSHPIITIHITTKRLLCPLPASDWTQPLQLSSILANAGISLLHNDTRQSHSLTATPPLFVPRFPELIPFNALSRAIFWRLVALLSHH